MTDDRGGRGSSHVVQDGPNELSNVGLEYEVEDLEIIDGVVVWQVHLVMGQP